MTKEQLQANPDLQKMLATPIWHTVLLCARTNYPRPSAMGVRDATTIINNEGELSGWLKCVEFLSSIGSVERPAPPRATQPYSEPAIKSEPKTK